MTSKVEAAPAKSGECVSLSGPTKGSIKFSMPHEGRVHYLKHHLGSVRGVAFCPKVSDMIFSILTLTTSNTTKNSPQSNQHVYKGTWDKRWWCQIYPQKLCDSITLLHGLHLQKAWLRSMVLGSRVRNWDKTSWHFWLLSSFIYPSVSYRTTHRELWLRTLWIYSRNVNLTLHCAPGGWGALPLKHLYHSW